MWSLVTAFLVAIGASLAATPLVRRLAVRVGAIDRPGAGHIHRRPIPLLGGVGIAVAFALSIAVLLFAHLDPQDRPAMIGVLVGGLLVLAVGVVDDTGEFWAPRLPWLADAERRGLRPVVKLLGQVLAASTLLPFGVVIHGMQNPFSTSLDWISFGWAAYPLTVFWVVAICNAVNLVDGLDGLAAGIASIASATLLVVALLAGDMAGAALLCAALLGAALGFLPWNFHPARIFMGDAGALFLGFALGAVSVAGPLKSTTLVALSVPALAIGLPVLDTVLAIVRRWGAGRMVGTRDHAHVHHRLMAMGLSHRDAVLALYVVSGWLGISALAVAAVGPLFGGFILLFVILSVVLGARLAGVLPRRHRTPAAERQTSFQA